MMADGRKRIHKRPPNIPLVVSRDTPPEPLRKGADQHQAYRSLSTPDTPRKDPK